MKKVLIALLLVLLTVGLIVACNGDVNQLMENNSYRTTLQKIGGGLDIYQLDILNNHQLAFYYLYSETGLFPFEVWPLANIIEEYTKESGHTWYIKDDECLAEEPGTTDGYTIKTLPTYVVETCEGMGKGYIAIERKKSQTILYFFDSSYGISSFYSLVEPANRLVWNTEPDHDGRLWTVDGNYFIGGDI